MLNDFKGKIRLTIVDMKDGAKLVMGLISKEVFNQENFKFK